MIPIILTVFIIPAIVLSGMRFMQYEQALKQYVTTGQLYVESFQGDDDELYNKWMNSYYEYNKDDQPYEFSMKKQI